MGPVWLLMSLRSTRFRTASAVLATFQSPAPPRNPSSGSYQWSCRADQASTASSRQGRSQPGPKFALVLFFPDAAVCVADSIAAFHANLGSGDVVARASRVEKKHNRAAIHIAVPGHAHQPSVETSRPMRCKFTVGLQVHCCATVRPNLIYFST